MSEPIVPCRECGRPVPVPAYLASVSVTMRCTPCSDTAALGAVEATKKANEADAAKRLKWQTAGAKGAAALADSRRRGRHAAEKAMTHDEAIDALAGVPA